MAVQETVLITGASSGIGWELAKKFAQDGARLVLVARSTEKLKQLASELHRQHHVECVVLPCDLAEPDGPARLVAELTERRLTVDVLVNNAGFGQLGQFNDIPLERHLSMVQVNISALVELTHRLLPGMLSRRSGSVLNIGSTASFQPGPNSAVYYASKAFVLSFSEALYSECQPHNVCVSCLCPGPTKTGFGADSKMDQSLVFRMNSMPVEAVAAAGYRAVRKRQRLVIPGLMNWLGAFSVRFTVRPVVLWFMARLNSTAGSSNANH